VTKNIGDNYKIYNLIIILNARIVVNVRCGLFKMSNVSHLTMLLPTRLPAKYLGQINSDSGFTFYLIQIIINVVKCRATDNMYIVNDATKHASMFPLCTFYLSTSLEFLFNITLLL